MAMIKRFQLEKVYFPGWFMKYTTTSKNLYIIFKKQHALLKKHFLIQLTSQKNYQKGRIMYDSSVEDSFMRGFLCGFPEYDELSQTLFSFFFRFIKVQLRKVIYSNLYVYFSCLVAKFFTKASLQSTTASAKW